jgi:hypothetical protein
MICRFHAQMLCSLSLLQKSANPGEGGKSGVSGFLQEAPEFKNSGEKSKAKEAMPTPRLQP